MKLLRYAGLFTALISLSAGLAFAGNLKDIAKDEWGGIYDGSTKIGYYHRIVKKDTYQDKEAYRTEEIVKIHYKAEKEMIYVLNCVLYADESFVPVFETSKESVQLTINGSTQTHETSVEAKYFPKAVTYTASDGTNTDKKTIFISSSDNFISAVKFAMGIGKYKVGDKVKLTRFDLQRLVISQSVLTVDKREKLQIKDKTYDTLLATKSSKDQTIKTWLLDSGDVVKEGQEGGNLITILETREQALKGID